MRSIHKWLIGLVTSVLAGAVFSQTAPILLTLKLEQAGETLATPAVMVEPRLAASIVLDDRVLLEVRAFSGYSAADLQMRLLVRREDGLVVVATPRIVTDFDKESAIEFQTTTGEKFRLTLKAQVGDRMTGGAKVEARVQ